MEGQLSLDDLLKFMTKKGASDLHLKPMRPPLLRIRGNLTPIKSVPLKPKEVEEMLMALLTPSAAAEARGAPVGGPRLRRAGRGALPLQRLLAARLDRGGLPPHPVRDQELRRPQPARRGGHLLPPPGRPGAGHRPHRLRQVDHPGRDHPGHLAQPAPATSSPSRTRSSSCSPTTWPPSRSARSAPTPRRSSEALRNAMRQDPDVIMVGEMRDLETIGHRHHRGRDRAPGLLDPAHQQRHPDHRPHHRHLPLRPAGPAPRPSSPRSSRPWSRCSSSSEPTGRA